METKVKMIYWKRDKFWLGKLLTHVASLISADPGLFFPLITISSHTAEGRIIF
jgi:hypothetical protein